MKTKTVAIIDNSVAFTGALRSALTLARQLERLGYQVVFVLPKGSSVVSSVENGFECIQLPMRELRRDIWSLITYLPSLLANAWQLRRLLKERSIDILVMNDYYNLLGSVSRLFGFNGLLYTFVRLLPSKSPMRLGYIWSRLAQHLSTRVVAISTCVLRELVSNPNTSLMIDAADFPDMLPTPAEQNDPLRILYLGNYIPGKGQEHALDATELLIARSDIPPFKLIFVGGTMGLAKNEQYLERLKGLALRKNLDEIVEFRPFSAGVEPLYRSSDIALNLSHAESFSMTCLEASFYGLPIIATKCGGPEEIVVHGVTGLLVDVADVVKVCESLYMLLASKELREKLGRQGREHVRQKFSQEKYQEQVRSLFPRVSSVNVKMGSECLRDR